MRYEWADAKRHSSLITRHSSLEIFMDRAKQRVETRGRIRERVRGKVSGTTERPRLAIFKSQKYLYAQIIDDVAGQTLATASSKDSDSGAKGANAAAAKAVGALIAKRAKDKGIKRVVF